MNLIRLLSLLTMGLAVSTTQVATAEDSPSSATAALKVKGFELLQTYNSDPECKNAQQVLTSALVLKGTADGDTAAFTAGQLANMAREKIKVCTIPIDSYAGNRARIFSRYVLSNDGVDTPIGFVIVGQWEGIQSAFDIFKNKFPSAKVSRVSRETKVADVQRKSEKGDYYPYDIDPTLKQADAISGLNRARVGLIYRRCGETCIENVDSFVVTDTLKIGDNTTPMTIVVRVAKPQYLDWYMSISDKEAFSEYGPLAPIGWGALTVCVADLGEIFKNLCSPDGSLEHQVQQALRSSVDKAMEQRNSNKTKADM